MRFFPGWTSFVHRQQLSGHAFFSPGTGLPQAGPPPWKARCAVDIWQRKRLRQIWAGKNLLLLICRQKDSCGSSGECGEHLSAVWCYELSGTFSIASEAFVRPDPHQTSAKNSKTRIKDFNSPLISILRIRAQDPNC